MQSACAACSPAAGGVAERKGSESGPQRGRTRPGNGKEPARRAQGPSPEGGDGTNPERERHRPGELGPRSYRDSFLTFRLLSFRFCRGLRALRHPLPCSLPAQGIAGWGTELAAGLGARGRDRLWELAGPDIPQARCAIPASIFRRYRRCSVRADTADTAAVDSAAGPPPGSLASAPPSRSPPPVLPVRPPPAPFPPLPFPPAVR
eukprot:gene13497-biopygen12104